MYSFCNSLCVINVGSEYGLPGDPIYILYLYDHMWLVGKIVGKIKYPCKSMVSLPGVIALLRNYSSTGDQKPATENWH